jgi:hypothetical protein
MNWFDNDQTYRLCHHSSLQVRANFFETQASLAYEREQLAQPGTGNPCLSFTFTFMLLSLGNGTVH